MQVWNTSGELLKELPQRAYQADRRSGEFLLLTESDLRLYNPAGEVVQTYDKIAAEQARVMFSADGGYVLASVAGAALIWQRDGRQRSPVALIGDESIRAGIAAAAGLYILTSSERSYRLYNEQGKQLAEWNRSLPAYLLPTASGNPRLLLANNNNGLVTQHLLADDDLLRMAGCVVGRGLSAAEMARYGISSLYFNYEQQQCSP